MHFMGTVPSFARNETKQNVFCYRKIVNKWLCDTSASFSKFHYFTFVPFRAQGFVNNYNSLAEPLQKALPYQYLDSSSIYVFVKWQHIWICLLLDYLKRTSPCERAVTIETIKSQKECINIKLWCALQPGLAYEPCCYYNIINTTWPIRFENSLAL